MKKIKKSAILIFAFVIMLAGFLSGCVIDDLPDSPSVENVNMIQQEEGVSIYWSIRSRSREIVDSFDICIDILQVDNEWKEIYATNVCEGDASPTIYDPHHNRSIYYSFHIPQVELDYGAYRVRMRSLHCGQIDDWLDNYKGVFIDGGSMQPPQNVRQEGAFLYWDAVAVPNTIQFYPEGLTLPDSDVGIKPHNYWVYVYAVDSTGKVIFDHISGVGDKTSYDLRTMGGLPVKKLRKLTITVSVITTEAVYDFVKFSQSQKSQTVAVDNSYL